MPGGNDILASVTSLFASHNRMHDCSYFLGFTELNYNLQDNNFGNRAEGVLPRPARATRRSATSRPARSPAARRRYLGRDNANQITLQDGVPGITNQYLFQPIAGAFYAPCVDGDFDMTHRRPRVHPRDLQPHGGRPGRRPHRLPGRLDGRVLGRPGRRSSTCSSTTTPPAPARGSSVRTPPGNVDTGIRNYALDRNPLQYGDLGYDVTGPEVHADGEPWSAVMWDVRQALVDKYNGVLPGDQRRAAAPLRAGRHCSNTRRSRRWPPASARATGAGCS